MSDVTVDLDSLVEGARREFREALADAMEAMEEGDCVQVKADPGDELDDGASPYVQVLRFGDSILVQVASNRHLATNQRLTKRSRRHLHELGLTKPTAIRRAAEHDGLGAGRGRRGTTRRPTRLAGLRRHCGSPRPAHPWFEGQH